MDVKTGSGAFMPTLEGARELAHSIAGVANGAGLPTVALITDMNEPLASAAGNAVEVQNAVDYLTGARREARLHAVTLALGAELLRSAAWRAKSTPARAALRASARRAARRRSDSSAWSRARRPRGFPRAMRRAFLPKAPMVRRRGAGAAPAMSAESTCARSASRWSNSAAAARAPADEIDPAVG